MWAALIFANLFSSAESVFLVFFFVGFFIISKLCPTYSAAAPHSAGIVATFSPAFGRRIGFPNGRVVRVPT